MGTKEEKEGKGEEERLNPSYFFIDLVFSFNSIQDGERGLTLFLFSSLKDETKNRIRLYGKTIAHLEMM